jgi:predicted hydrocarbon binding protein
MTDFNPTSNQDLLWMISDSLQELFPGKFTGMIQCPGGYTETQKPGQENLHDSPYPIDSLIKIQILLEDCFGDKSAQGILTRIGRSSFFSYLKTRGEMFGWFDSDYKMLSTRKRLVRGLETLSQNLYHNDKKPIPLTSTDKTWIWQDPDCPWCMERISHGSSCSFTTGFLQEFTYWAGAGKTYLVREVECRAAGGQACVYHIDKKPLD